jgi:hypothetical protein
MKAGITAIAIGIVTAVIRFVPGLEGSSMLEPTAVVPSAPTAASAAITVQDDGSRIGPNKSSCSPRYNGG